MTETQRHSGPLPHASGAQVPQIASPIRFGQAPSHAQTQPPMLGRHSDEVLAELGYGADEISASRAAGVI